MKKMVLILASWLYLTLAHAFAPEPGLWVIDAENNGQPGRGFQVDIQGSTFVLTFYGYAADGDAQWYLSAGTLSSNSFTGTLEQYEGGMAFGQTQVAARGAGGAGTVQLSFSDATHGSIKLPGESWKSISRMNFARPSDPDSLNGSYVLERAIVINSSTGQIADTRINMSATGTMSVNNGSMSQSITVTANGTTQTIDMDATYSDHGAYFSATTSQGASNTPWLIKRGDEMITLAVTGDYTEVDHWRRVSATASGLAAESARAAAEGAGAGTGLQVGTGAGTLLRGR